MRLTRSGLPTVDVGRGMLTIRKDVNTLVQVDLGVRLPPDSWPWIAGWMETLPFEHRRSIERTVVTRVVKSLSILSLDIPPEVIGIMPILERRLTLEEMGRFRSEMLQLEKVATGFDQPFRRETTNFARLVYRALQFGLNRKQVNDDWWADVVKAAAGFEFYPLTIVMWLGVTHLGLTNVEFVSPEQLEYGWP